MKTNRIKKLVIVTLVLTMLLSLVACGGKKDEKTTAKNQCTMTISVEKLLDTAVLKDAGNENKQEYVPEDGFITKDVTVYFEDGETAYDVLIKYLDENKIAWVIDDSYGSPYITEIGYLGQFDGGDMSGWMYYVNETSPEVGAGDYKLTNGDHILWFYSLNYGEDVIFN